MANYRVRIETTRAGNYQVRDFNRDGVVGRDGTIITIGKYERATIDGKVLAGKNLANRYKEKAIAEHHRNSLGGFDSTETLLPLIDRFLEECESRNFSPRTISHYRYSLMSFPQETGANVLGDLKREKIQSWLENMRQHGWAGRTINGRLADLRTWLKWLMRIGKLSQNPFSHDLMPKRKQSEPKFYTAQEYALLDAKLAEIHPLARLGCALAHSAGLRKAEMVGHAGDPATSPRIQWEDIRWLNDGAELLIRKELTKTNHSRTVPLDEGIIALLGSRRSGPIIPLTRFQFDHFFRRARQEAGINADLDIHGLRHTFAKNYLQRGEGNLASLKILMGHASIVSTMIYAQFEKSYLKEGIDRAYRRRLIEESLAGELQVNLSGRSGLRHPEMHRDAPRIIKQTGR